MLNRLSVKGRMYIINVSILVLFVTMVVFSVRNSNGVKDLGIQKTGQGRTPLPGPSGTSAKA